MLPAAARVRTRRDHQVVARAGRRARRGALLVAVAPSSPAGSQPPRAAAVAGRKVGPAVVRNRVKRRIREHVRARLHELPPGSMLVVRALPGAADASYSELGSWLDAGLRACVGPRSAAAADRRPGNSLDV